MKNLTHKEVEFLKNIDFKNQNIWDKGSTSVMLKDMQPKSKQSKRMISGLMSSLQRKQVISLDESNGAPVIYIGYLFTEDQEGEDLFNEYTDFLYNN